MSDWTIPHHCSGDWLVAWRNADDLTDTINQDRLNLNSYIPYISDPYAAGAISTVGTALFHIILCFREILNVDHTYQPEYNAIYYAVHHCQNTGNGITWKDIINAWVGMNKAETMWTVDFIDQMRQIVWNESITLKLQANPFV